MSSNHSSLSNQSAKIWTGAACGVGLLLVLDLLQVLVPVRSGLERLFLPVGAIGRTMVRLGVWPWQVIKTNYRAYERIQDLESRYSEALAQLGQRQALEKENQYLKNLLNAGANRDKTVIIAAQIIADGQPAVAVGTEDGVVEGAVVMVEQTMVGRIGQLSPHRAKVRLMVRDLDLRIMAETSAGVSGVVRGDGRQLLLTEVPLGDEVRVGESVLTIGQEGVPSQLLLGVISQVKTQPTDPVQTLVIDPVVTFYETTLVEIR